MPWRETSAMDERLRFVQDVHRPGWSIAELCRRYDVSRKTGYKWLCAYERGGPAALADGSHRPHTSPQATPLSVVRLILRVAAPLPVGRAEGAPPALGPRARRPGADQDDDPSDPRAPWPGAAAAPEPAPDASGRPRHADGAAQRGLDRRFQRAIPHWQQRVLLPAHDPGRGDALPARLPWAARADHRRQLAGV